LVRGKNRRYRKAGQPASYRRTSSEEAEAAAEAGLETAEAGAVVAVSGEVRLAEAGVPFGFPKKCEQKKRVREKIENKRKSD
jgi:hypothetical protein